MSSEIDLFLNYLLSNTRTEYLVGPPATPEQVNEYEAAHNVKLPPDIREYFLKINGADQGFFALRAMKDWCRFPLYKYYEDYFNEHLSQPIEDYFLIGTYDIGVWHWLIQLYLDPTIPTPITVIHLEEKIIADSFSEFLQKWRLNEPEYLLGP